MPRLFNDPMAKALRECGLDPDIEDEPNGLRATISVLNSCEAAHQNEMMSPAVTE